MENNGEFKYSLAEVVKCSNCGADMVYDPLSGKLKCAYCDSMKEILKKPSYMRDYESEKSKGTINSDDKTYKCPNCGGIIELSSFETATACPFCGATTIVKFDDIKGMKPDSILPFLISNENAAQAGKKWIKKKLLAPGSLRKSLQVENFKGVYFPSFGFDTDTYSSYYGRLGEKRTRTVGTGNDQHKETYIEWYEVKGTWKKNFYDVMVEASAQLTQKEMKNILPYDMKNAEAYNKDYLSGFGAERYDTPIEESYSVAKAQMDATIRSEILNKYHADEVDYLNIDTDYSNKKFRYTLLPVWICMYKWKNKLYRFLVNGRTGTATGKAPKSPIRVAFTALLIAAIVAVVVFLAIMNN